LALIGGFFVFLSFCSTTTFFPVKFTPAQAEYARSYIWQEAFLSLFFAMSSSVISSSALSVLFKGKTGEWEVILGIICGGIVFGPIAGTAVNIGAAIACGLISGVIVSIYCWQIHKRINSKRLNDCYGAFGVFIVSLISTFGISPIILITYYVRSWILPTLEVSNYDTKGLPLINGSIAGWVLTYVGVSIGVSMGSALIAGLIFRLVQSPTFEGSRNNHIFTLEYGLTPGNPEIFEEDLDCSSDFQRIRKVIRDQNC
jgi:ammonia channel protein AmtB